MRYQKSKKVVQKVIEQECTKHGIPIEVYPVTNVENIFYTIKNLKKLCINYDGIIEYIQINFFNNFNGYYDEKLNHLKILLTKIKNNQDQSPNQQTYLTNLLLVTYHEFGHRLYDETLKSSSELEPNKFIYYLEEYLQNKTNLYQLHSEEFQTEIYAELYGYQQTIKHLKRYPTIYKEVEEYLTILELYHQILNTNYDIEIFLNQYPEEIPLPRNKKINRTLILEEDWSLKELETKYIILSSRCFLEKLNYSTLTRKELQILSDAVSYSLEKEEKKYLENKKLEEQVKFIQDTFIKFQGVRSSLESILIKKQRRNHGKINYLEMQLFDIQQELRSRKRKKRK